MSGTLYVKLDASYPDDPKIIEAGEKAEVLYVRSLCLAKRILSDGFVADAHLPRFGLSSVNQRARKLCEVDLWRRDDQAGGYWITAWLKHNRPAAEVQEQTSKAKADAVLGNHRRWHSENPSPDCPHCFTPPDEPPDPPPDDEPESGTRSSTRSPEHSTAQHSTADSRSDSADASPDDVFSEQACAATRLLARCVKANGHKIPEQGTKNHWDWYVEVDRLMRLDGADPGEVDAVIRWATAHEFWRANIRSAGKLREQFSQLRLKRQAEQSSNGSGQYPPGESIRDMDETGVGKGVM